MQVQLQGQHDAARRLKDRVLSTQAGHVQSGAHSRLAETVVSRAPACTTG